MKVYVIRHGESENNRTERFTGWDDPHLTDRGREDAKKAAELLKNVRFDKIYVSDLRCFGKSTWESWQTSHLPPCRMLSGSTCLNTDTWISGESRKRSFAIGFTNSRRDLNPWTVRTLPCFRMRAGCAECWTWCLVHVCQEKAFAVTTAPWPSSSTQIRIGGCIAGSIFRKSKGAGNACTFSYV